MCTNKIRIAVHCQSTDTAVFKMLCFCADGARHRQNSSLKAKVKLYTFNGLCTVAACAIMYRNLQRATSESLTSEVAFQIVPYMHIIITLVCNVIQKDDVTTCFCDHRTADVKPSHCVYWTLTFMSLIAGHWLRLSNQNRSPPTSFAENALQISLCFVPLLSEIHYCRVCTEFKNDYDKLNKLVAADGGHLTLSKLLAIRAERKNLNDHMRKTTRRFGAQILSEIATTAVTTVFKIHRALRSAERFGSTVTSESAADLLDVLHRVLSLFAICKVSGDVTKEANKIVTNLLNTNPSTDKNLENEVLFFLWETNNPAPEVHLVYGTFALCPRLFVSVFSWCVGFILILLQFRWPRTY